MGAAGARAGGSLRLVVAAVVAATAAAGQRFADETEVLALDVPVQVLRDGEPVRGLTAADFAVSIGRRRQPVTGFEVVDLAAQGNRRGPESAAPLHAAAARRRLLFLFDLSFSRPRSLLEARRAAAELVGAGLHPDDLVAIATYSASEGPQLVLGFTADRRQIEAALEDLGLTRRPEPGAGTARDPLRLVVTGLGADPGAGSSPRERSARDRVEETATGFDPVLFDHLQSYSLLAERTHRDSRTNRIVALSRSLADLARLLGGVEGRKQVVYLSEGFDSRLFLGTADPAEVRRLSDAAEAAPYTVDSDERFGSTRAIADLERMLEEFRRADCVLQAIDVGGLRTGADVAPKRTSGQESLFYLARATGGDLYLNFNDLADALERLIERSSLTYVLTVEPDGLARDGSYHRLRVEAPRGARVVHRPGFYAPLPFVRRDPLDRLLEAGGAIVAGREEGTLEAAVLAAPFRRDGGAGSPAYVPVLVEVEGPELLAGSRGDALPVEVFAYALTPGGAVAAYFTQAFSLELPKVKAALARSGLKFFGHLELAPGDYSLRVLVRNGETGAYAARASPLAVPDFAAPRPALLPPFFPEPAERWLLVRETSAGAPAPPYPFLSGGVPYLPACHPALAAGKAARAELVAFRLGAGEVRIGARLIALDGRELTAQELPLLERERGDGDAPDRLAAAFRPDLPPGEYLLRITLTETGTGATETSAIPIVVTATDPG